MIYKNIQQNNLKFMKQLNNFNLGFKQDQNSR